MAFQQSPGVNFSEIDLTTIVPGVGTTIGAFVGDFVWGPINLRMTLDNEVTLVNTFGAPGANNFVDWFSAANFLAYATSLRVVRAANTTAALNATADQGGRLIQNEDTYRESEFGGTGIADGNWAARYAGSLGNSLRVSVCPSANAWQANTVATANVLVSNATVIFSANVKADAARPLVVGDLINIGGATGYIEVLAIDAAGLNVTINSASSVPASANLQSVSARWKYYGLFQGAPGTSSKVSAVNGLNDELHIIVLDRLGRFSGVANTIVEKYPFLSKASDADTDSGDSAYYRNQIADKSKYIYWLAHMDEGTNWGNTSNATTFTLVNKPYYINLAGGVDAPPTTANRETGWDQFKDKEVTDVSLLITGQADPAVQSYVIQNIAEVRQDAVTFLSPQRASVVNNAGSESTAAIADRNNLPSSSYAFMDSAWKYQFDKYNNLYRWLPCNADIAGIAARSDLQRDAWWPFAGLNRGQLKNVVKLSWNPSKAYRDDLYNSGINPVITIPGEGTYLFGDKTLLSKPSAFDRINVRRLFIVLEKAITRAARYSLFEFNDEFTRAAFVNLTEPFLRDVQGRRGIFAFRVVCDETNNTPEVIDRNEFVGDIYIKPARSINYIQLNFVATRTGVAFEEVVGKF